MMRLQTLLSVHVETAQLKAKIRGSSNFLFRVILLQCMSASGLHFKPYSSFSLQPQPRAHQLQDPIHMAPTFLSDRLSSTVLFSLCSTHAISLPCLECTKHVPTPQGHCTCQSLCLGFTGCRCPYDLFLTLIQTSPLQRPPCLPPPSILLSCMML